MSVEEQLEGIRHNQEEHNKADDRRFGQQGEDIMEIKKDVKDLKQDVSEIKESNATQTTDLSWIKEHLKKNGFASKEDVENVKERFEPVRKIVYAMVAIILVAFLGTLIYLVGWK